MFRYKEYIYRVYKEGNFSKAAETMRIAQSALSITVKKAEKLIGMEIFNRQTVPISLTPFGEQYIKSVNIINEQEKILENYIYSINNMQGGHLSIGTSTFWGIYLVSPAIMDFKKKYPNISIELYEDITTTLVEWLYRGRLDLLITSSEIDNKQYSKSLLCEECLFLVVPRELCPNDITTKYALPYSCKQKENSNGISVSLKSFRDIPFVLLRKGNTSRTLADKAFEEADIKPKIILEVDQAATSYKLACIGLGAALVSNWNIGVTGKNDNCFIFKLDTDVVQRNVYIYSKRNSILSKTSEMFCNTIHDVKNDMSTNVTGVFR